MNTWNEIINVLPEELIKFLLVVVFSLLIGLEQRRLNLHKEGESLFGTDRTYTLIGILGFVLYLLEPSSLIPFLGGGFLVGFLLAIFYFNKIKLQSKFGFTSVIVALITYCLAPIIYTQDAWFVILLVVVVLVLVEMKATLFKFSQKIDNIEFITLAKFLVIAGVILPLLPNQAISEIINFSPFKFWLAIVAVSGISYLSYILKKFVFPKSGVVLTGILGGLYSSTATTFILARKSKELQEDSKIIAGIILATSMMFVRIFILAFLFNKAIASLIGPVFAVFVLLSMGLAYYFFKKDKNELSDQQTSELIVPHSNPLEFKTSLVFGILFVVFAILTAYVTKYYGSYGIEILSFLVGVTDIDPFIINILQSQWKMNDSILAIAVINAVSSNNLLKMIYSISLSTKSIRKPLAISFGLLILTGVIASFFF